MLDDGVDGVEEVHGLFFLEAGVEGFMPNSSGSQFGYQRGGYQLGPTSAGVAATKNDMAILPPPSADFPKAYDTTIQTYADAYQPTLAAAVKAGQMTTDQVTLVNAILKMGSMDWSEYKTKGPSGQVGIAAKSNGLYPYFENVRSLENLYPWAESFIAAVYGSALDSDIKGPFSNAVATAQAADTSSLVTNVDPLILATIKKLGFAIVDSPIDSGLGGFDPSTGNQVKPDPSAPYQNEYTYTLDSLGRVVEKLTATLTYDQWLSGMSLTPAQINQLTGGKTIGQSSWWNSKTNTSADYQYELVDGHIVPQNMMYGFNIPDSPGFTVTDLGNTPVSGNGSGFLPSGGGGSSNSNGSTAGDGSPLANGGSYGTGSYSTNYNYSPQNPVPYIDVNTGVGNVNYNSPLGYATGGAFDVGGFGGPDSQLVNFRASPGERVNVSRPSNVRYGDGGGGGGGGGGGIVMHINGVTDANSFRRSEKQIMARLAKAVSNAAKAQ